MKSFEDCVDHSNNGKFDYYLKECDKLGLNSTESDSYLHRCLHMIRNRYFPNNFKRKITLVQSAINIERIMLNISQEKKVDSLIENLDCGIIKGKGLKFIYSFEYLIPNIIESIKNKKVLFILLDIFDYCITKDKKKKNKYEAHTMTLILTPDNNHYNCYFLNPHGRDMFDTLEYTYMLSSSREKTIKYKKPYEMVFINNFIKYINKSYTHKKNFIPIIYDYSAKHNYLGVNLQTADVEGICFIFPIIIWYYFGKYYKLNRVYQRVEGDIQINCGENLLKNGKFETFINSMFIDLLPEFKNEVFLQIQNPSLCSANRTDYLDRLEEIIEVKGKRFYKIMLKTIVIFLRQKEFKKRIKKELKKN